MTQTKFYLVLNEEEAQEKFFTKAIAIKDARELAKEEKKPFYLMECVRVFDVDINVVETSFEESSEESSPKFKVGDKVSAKSVINKERTIEATIKSFLNERCCFLKVLSKGEFDKDNEIYPFNLNDLTRI